MGHYDRSSEEFEGSESTLRAHESMAEFEATQQEASNERAQLHVAQVDMRQAMATRVAGVLDALCAINTPYGPPSLPHGPSSSSAAGPRSGANSPSLQRASPLGDGVIPLAGDGRARGLLGGEVGGSGGIITSGHGEASHAYPDGAGAAALLPLPPNFGHPDLGCRS